MAQKKEYAPPTECHDNLGCPYPYFEGTLRNASARTGEWFYREDEYPFTFIINCKDINPEVDSSPIDARDRIKSEKTAAAEARKALALAKQKTTPPPPPKKQDKVIHIADDPVEQPAKPPPIQKKQPFNNGKPQPNAWIEKKNNNLSPMKTLQTEPVPLPSGYKATDQKNQIELLKPSLDNLTYSVNSLAAWATEMAKKQTTQTALVESHMASIYNNTQAAKDNTSAIKGLTDQLLDYSIHLQSLNSKLDDVILRLNRVANGLNQNNKRLIDVEETCAAGDSHKKTKKENLSQDEILFFGQKLTEEKKSDDDDPIED